MSELLKQAEELQNEVIMHRRRLHQFAEIEFELPQTFSYVWDTLEKLGYQPQKIGKSSICAVIGSGSPCFLVRADMDALPMAEQTGLPFAAKNGHMHSCGHDCHTAMLLGAAKLLKMHEAEIHGQIKLLFQAAEEILEGAKESVDAGILENPKVDAAMMMHIMAATVIEDGSICFPAAGNCYASADWFRIDVEGKGGHGAMPHMTKSAINTLCAINTGIQEIMGYSVPPVANASMTIGEIHAGNAGNIIPDRGYMCGTIRTYDEKVRTTIKEDLAALVRTSGEARGTSATLSYGHCCPPACNDPEMRKFAMGAAKELLGEAKVTDMDLFYNGTYRLINASEDFAYIAEKVPSLICLFAAGTFAEGYGYGSHHPKFDINEQALYAGSAGYAHIAMEWLRQHSAN